MKTLPTTYAANPAVLARLISLRDRINSINLPSSEWLHGISAFLCDADGGPAAEDADNRPIWLAIDITLHFTYGQRDETLRDSAHWMAVRAIERIVGSPLIQTGDGWGNGVSIECYSAAPKNLSKFILNHLPSSRCPGAG